MGIKNITIAASTITYTIGLTRRKVFCDIIGYLRARYD